MSGKAAGVFKKSFLGGFNRADVLAYFDKVSYQHEQDKKELHARISSLEEDNKRLSDDMLACSSQLAEEQERAQTSAAYASDLRAELSRQQFLAESKNNEIQLQKSLCSQLQCKAGEYEKTIAALEQHKCELEAAASGQNDTIARLRSEAETNRQALALLEQKLLRISDEKAAAEDQITHLTQLLSDANRQMAQLTAELEKATAERSELEQRYREAVASAEASAASLSAFSAVQETAPQKEEESPHQQLSDVQERIGYIDNELLSFKDEIQELRRLTIDSLNHAEKKLVKIENTLNSTTQKFDNVKNVAQNRTAVPQKRTAASSRAVYLTAKESKNSLLDTVTTALDSLVARWSK